MSHTIRVSDKVKGLILKYMGPQESFSHVIERAFVAFEALTEIGQTLGPAHHLVKRIERDTDALREARLERADLESRTLQ